jgi:hypothetical protein
MMDSPMIRIVFVEKFNNKLRAINPTPIVAITSNRKTLKCGSNHTPKLTSVNSKTINHMPRVIRNFLVDAIFLSRLKERKADAPERKTKVGAHK